MSRPIQVLFVTSDPDLAAEWSAAESALSDVRTVAYFAEVGRDGVQVAQNRQPEVICLDVGGAESVTLANELREAAPGAHIVGLLDRRHFDSGDAETASVVAATRAGVRDFLRRPLSSNEVVACMRRLLDDEAGRHESAVRAARVICFVSNKGGVGKSSMSINLACELARRAPGRVLLVDAALQLGLCATMLDLVPTVTMHDVVTQLDRLDTTLLRELTVPHASGLDLLAAPHDAVQAAAIHEDVLSRMLAVARHAYDFVIVDTFPMLDGIAIAALDRADEVWQVVAPTVPTVLGAERLIELLESVGVEESRQRIVVNVSVPPHPGRLSARDVATRLKREVDLVVPFSRRVVSAGNSGQPAVMTGGRFNRFRRAIEELANRIERPTVSTPERVG